MKRRLIGVAAAVLGTMLMGGVVVQTASAADPLPTTVELPLFGAPLTLGISTGPGGALTEVTVAPATNVVAHKLSPRKVVFKAANAAGDSAKIEVKSKKGGQSVSARAGSLDDISGPGKWTGDVFGTGTATTVTFEIGMSASGGPDIIGTAISPGGAAGLVGDVKYSSDDDDDEIEQSARVSIKFTDAASDQSRTLTIKVKVEEEEDGETEAKLSISLSRLKGVAVLAAEAAGLHTWTGLLCDNTTATINYTLDTDGSVVTGSATATPTTAEVRTDDDKIDVRFASGERVRIKVKSDDGMIRIDVKERIRCDSADPTTNAETTTTVDDDDDDDGDHDDESRGRGGRDDDDDDDDDDDNTSTTVTTGA